MRLSVVVPLMNEEKNIKPLLEKIYSDLKDIDFELILVDDGSTDRTVEEIKRYARKGTKLITLNRNYGQTTGYGSWNRFGSR